MKIEMKFSDLERDEAEALIKAEIYRDRFNAVWDVLFRPRHKHGYQSAAMRDLLEHNCCNELMDELENLFASSFNDLD